METPETLGEYGVGPTKVTTPPPPLAQGVYENSSDGSLPSSTLPCLSEVPLHIWVKALTHPVTGTYPTGVRLKDIDRLAKQSGIVSFPNSSGSRFHDMWKTPNHLGVYLSDEVKAGRLQRVALGKYSGYLTKDSVAQKSWKPGNSGSGVVSSARTSASAGSDQSARSCNKRKATLPQRRSATEESAKRPRCEIGLSESTTTDDRSSFSSGNDALNNSMYKSTNGTAVTDDELDERTGSKRRHLSEDVKPVQINAVAKVNKPNTTPSRGENAVEKVAPTSTTSSSTSNRRKCGTKKICKANHDSDMDEFGLPLIPLSATLKNMSPKSMLLLTAAETANLCDELGFYDGGQAFLREEIDGIAFMLLTRSDILNNLALKLGPALKLHRFVRTVQKLIGSRLSLK